MIRSWKSRPTLARNPLAANTDVNAPFSWPSIESTPTNGIRAQTPVCVAKMPSALKLARAVASVRRLLSELALDFGCRLCLPSWDRG